MDFTRIQARYPDIKIIAYEPQYREQVVAIAHEIHLESIYADMPFDEDKIIRQLACCGSLAPDRYFMLAVRQGVVLGGFFGHVRRTFFCDELLAHDMGWWVQGIRRGSAAAILLLADFEAWAKQQGAKKVMVGQSNKNNVARTTKLYEHCGFTILGFNTVKDI